MGLELIFLTGSTSIISLELFVYIGLDGRIEFCLGRFYILARNLNIIIWPKKRCICSVRYIQRLFQSFWQELGRHIRLAEALDISWLSTKDCAILIPGLYQRTLCTCRLRIGTSQFGFALQHISRISWTTGDTSLFHSCLLLDVPFGLFRILQLVCIFHQVKIWLERSHRNGLFLCSQIISFLFVL